MKNDATLPRDQACIDMTGFDTTAAAAPAHHLHCRGERKMDIWLRRALTEAHDEVLTEGLPADWLAMIDERLTRG